MPQYGQPDGRILFLGAIPPILPIFLSFGVFFPSFSWGFFTTFGWVFFPPIFRAFRLLWGLLSVILGEVFPSLLFWGLFWCFWGLVLGLFLWFCLFLSFWGVIIHF